MTQPQMEELLDRVESDPALNAAEKETTLTMYGDEKSYSIQSSKRTVVKSLLKHDHFEFEWANVVLPGLGDGVTRVKSRDKLEQAEAIYSVKGTMPVGCLTVKSSPRSNDHQSSIVNAEKIDPDAFA